MKTATIPSEIYGGAGFAVAVIDEAAETVLRMVYTDGNFDNPEVTKYRSQIVLSDEEEENENIRVAVGMASGHEFCYLFTAAERKAMVR